MLRGAIFDLDGTLLDSMEVWKDSSRLFLRQYGVETVTEEDIRNLEGKTQLQALRYFAAVYPVIGRPGEALQEAFQAFIARRYAALSAPKAGVRRLLRRLEEQKIPRCVVSMTDIRHCEGALENFGLAHAFDFLLSAGQVGLNKREPRIYQLAAARLGIPPSACMVFEDAPYAARTAKQAGFPVCIVYDRAFDREWPAMAQWCDAAVRESFEEILPLFG